MGRIVPNGSFPHPWDVYGVAEREPSQISEIRRRGTDRDRMARINSCHEPEIAQHYSLARTATDSTPQSSANAVRKAPTHARVRPPRRDPWAARGAFDTVSGVLSEWTGGQSMDDSTLDLGPERGSWRIQSHDELLQWAEHQREKWAWLEGAHDPSGAAARLFGRFNQLQSQIAQDRAQGLQLAAAVNNVGRFFAPNADAIELAESELGATVHLIGQLHGRTAAASALGLLREWTSPRDLSTLEQFRGAVAAMVPSSLQGEQATALFSRERNTYREALRRAVSETRQGEENRALATAGAIQQMRAETGRIARLLARRWIRRRIRDRGIGSKSVSDIRAVEAAYREFMQLQAPAEYWAAKSEDHKRAEKDAMHRLQAFFVVALILTAVAFSAVGWFLISSAEIATAVYVVVSAGLATYTGLVFWAGRLLTRLYLSEHHLRKDADERRVMTTTYLALTQERAAEEADRQIILAALFRSSSDGIVKDDGGIDPSLAAALARLGMGR